MACLRASSSAFFLVAERLPPRVCRRTRVTAPFSAAGPGSCRSCRSGDGPSIGGLLLVLRPFAPAAFTAFFATMASADSSNALAPEVSPGRVHELSARAVRPYPMRFSVTVGFRVSSHAHRPHRGLAAGSYSRGRAFATDFFRAERLAAPALSSATVVVTASGHLFSYDGFMPMPGTRARTSVRSFPLTRHASTVSPSPTSTPGSQDWQTSPSPAHSVPPRRWPQTGNPSARSRTRAR